MQRFKNADFPDGTRLQQEQNLFEPLLTSNILRRWETDRRARASNGWEDRRLMDIEAEKINDAKFEEEEVSKNGEIVTMCIETGIHLNRIKCRFGDRRFS